MLLPASACARLESLGPTPLDEGVVLYLDHNFVGPSQALNLDVPDLRKVHGACNAGEGTEPTWNDCISSIRVLPGWSVTIYEDPDYRGESAEITADVSDLAALSGPCTRGFNDCISSLKVHKSE